MTAKTLFLPLLLTTLAACAQVPNSNEPKPAAALSTDKTQAETPVSGLSESVLYQLLLGEIAAQRGEPQLAAEAYVDLASKTRDARVAKRAVEMAIKARQMEQALIAARLWVELEPDNARGRQVLVPLLVSKGLMSEAKPHLQSLLAGKNRSTAMDFLHMQSLLGRYQDKDAGLALVEDIAKDYLSLPESHYAVAQAAWQAGKLDRAAQAIDVALELKPGWEAAALFRGQLFQREGDAALLAYWKDYLAANPNAGEVRMAYAKALARTGEYNEARAEFGQLMKQSGDNPEIAYAIGLLSLQINDFDGAEASLLQALELGYPDEATVRMYLAQVSESRERPDEALARYDAIGPGDRYLESRIKSAVLLGKLKRTQEGKARLDTIQPASDKERVQLIQAEAQMLRESGDLRGAFAVLDRAVKAAPDSTDLLYDRAMAAEKIDRLDVLEADLRRIIKLEPEFAHAYNALGYTLADRTQRIDEALQVLEKAIKLSPDDAFILDSMGWALFKAKRLPEAETHLRKAYTNRADPEIAAHLGEVLWVLGKKDEARRVWGEASKLHPDNAVLRETVARLQP